MNSSKINSEIEVYIYIYIYKLIKIEFQNENRTWEFRLIIKSILNTCRWRYRYIKFIKNENNSEDVIK